MVWKKKGPGVEGVVHVPAGVLNRAEMMVEVRQGLEKARHSIEKWVRAVESVKEAEMYFAKNFPSQSGNETLDSSFDCQALNNAIESISAKIETINDARKQVDKLQPSLLAMTKAKKRFEAKNKDEQEFRDAANAYFTLLASINGSFDFLVEQCEGRGAGGLAEAELQVMLRSQQTFFEKEAEKIRQSPRRQLQPKDDPSLLGPQWRNSLRVSMKTHEDSFVPQAMRELGFETPAYRQQPQTQPQPQPQPQPEPGSSFEEQKEAESASAKIADANIRARVENAFPVTTQPVKGFHTFVDKATGDEFWVSEDFRTLREHIPM